jgi:hypothetical protein
MRERLCRSQRPDRVVEVALEAALAAGLLGRRRVLDSTPLYDAVATMDTITLIRSAIRGLLATAEADLAALLRAAISSGDDYARGGKPVIDWDDTAAREALVDSRARDGYALLVVLDGQQRPSEPVTRGDAAAGHGAGPPGNRAWTEPGGSPGRSPFAPVSAEFRSGDKRPVVRRFDVLIAWADGNGKHEHLFPLRRGQARI